MQKDQAYHESAIKYNEVLAECAETLAPDLVDEEVRKWCVAVGKQHRFHAKRHRSALNKILLRQTVTNVESVPDGLDVPPMEEATPEETVEAAPVDENVLEDGCVKYHNPSLASCIFAPKAV